MMRAEPSTTRSRVVRPLFSGASDEPTTRISRETKVPRANLAFYSFSAKYNR
jgi:hypothetical protein